MEARFAGVGALGDKPHFPQFVGAVINIDARKGKRLCIEEDVPAIVHLTEPDGAVTVPLRFRMSRAVESGRWDVRITARTRTRGVAVAPDSVTVRASVPRALTLSRDQKERLILWISGGIGGLALAGFLVLKLLRRGAPDSGYAYVQQPDEETLKELLQEDEMVVLEGFEDRRH